MVKFTSQKDFEKWLRDKPIDIMATIAARTLLRITPNLIGGVEIKNTNSMFILPIFRSSAATLAYAVGAVGSTKVGMIAFEASVLADEVSEPVIYARDVALCAAMANMIEGHSHPSRQAANIVRSATKVSDDFWKIASNEATMFDDGFTRDHIFSEKLWSVFTEPDWSLKHWYQLKYHLSKSPDEYWQVWINWWEDRRDGKPYNIAMEREIVLIADEHWQKGPAHVNPMIAEIRARYAARATLGPSDIPFDNSVAPRFETVGERIALRGDPPDPPDPPDEQEALYNALREQTVELNALCPQNSNRYAQQGKAVAVFLAALGDDYGSMRLSALWIAGQRMRRFERADAAKRAAEDPEDEPMEPDQSALFGEVVTTYNVFSTGEAALKAKDELGRDPATLTPDVTEEAKAVRGAVAEASGLFDEEAVLALDTVIEETDDPLPGVEARGIVLTRETFENLLGALARKARSEPDPGPSEVGKGAKAAIGASLVGGSAFIASAFIASYETILIAFATKLPASSTWIAIIKSIAAKWDKLI